MKSQAIFLYFFVGILACLSGFCVKAEDAYRYFTWTVTYGTISPLGVPQQVGLISGFCPLTCITCYIFAFTDLIYDLFFGLDNFVGHSYQ